MRLSEAVEDMKQFYIQKLLEAGVLDDSVKDPSFHSLSELENLVKFYKL